MTTRSRPSLTATTGLTLSQGLRSVAQILRLDAVGLTRYLEEQAGENPALVLAPPAPPPGDWFPGGPGPFAPAGAADAAEAAAAGPASLMAHVMAAVVRLCPDRGDRNIAEALSAALEPSGWLGRPLSAIAAETGAPLARVEAVLARLQNIEPAGLFARSLRECLSLQAAEAGWLDPVMQTLIAHLDLVASGDLGGLARRAGCDATTLAQALRRLRSLNPKPGTQFETAAAPVREPDLMARQTPEGWTVAANRGALPAVTLRPDAAAGRAQLSAARDLARLVELRGRTLLAIGSAIVARQQGALEHGLAELVPMTMADIAAATDLSASTVSRAVAGASIDTPRGTLWLRALFSQAPGGAEDGPAAAALRARIARLVASEPGHAPLTDDVLARKLAETTGAPVARRTVAKYRAMLSIPPAHRRRIRRA
ncbi:MAG TPA: RNA polymerase sigma-54 factor [Paracoccaceae bacterium]|nr:RNA polymerase sigma-54 factor [Paracoccaceae bacterium]